jgi:hypothetical protein
LSWYYPAPLYCAVAWCWVQSWPAQKAPRWDGTALLYNCTWSHWACSRTCFFPCVWIYMWLFRSVGQSHWPKVNSRLVTVSFISHGINPNEYMFYRFSRPRTQSLMRAELSRPIVGSDESFDALVSWFFSWGYFTSNKPGEFTHGQPSSRKLCQKTEERARKLPIR